MNNLLSEMSQYFFQNTLNAIVLEDSQRNILAVNQAFCNLFFNSCKPNEIVGKSCSTLSCEVSEYFIKQEAFYSIIEKCSSDKIKSTGNIFTTKDGTILNLTYLPVIIADEFHGQVWTFSEVTSLVNLENENKLYQEIIESSDSILFKCTSAPELKIEFISNNISTLGYDAKDIVENKTPFRSLVHPDDVLALERYTNLAIATGQKRFSQHYRMIKKSGEPVYIDELAIPTHDSKGNNSGFIGIIKDITEKSLIEKQLGIIQERLNFAMDGSQSGIWDWNVKTGETYYSPRWKAIVGYKDDELENHFDTWDRLAHPDDRLQTLQDIHNHIQKKTKFFTNIHRMKHKDGSYVWILAKGRVAERDEEGTPLRMVGTHNDITEQMVLQDQLELQAKIMDIHIPFIKFDEELTVLEVSDSYCNLTGYDYNELVGFNAKELKSRASTIQELSEIKELIRSGKSWKGEAQSTKKNGEPYWIEITVQAMYNINNEFEGGFAIVNDITDKKKIEQISMTDELTGAYNRRYFNQTIENEINRARRQKHNLIFAIFDIDHFKLYNDTYGHPAGDKALKDITNVVLNELSRSSDFLFRLGGEEFGILCVDMTEKEVQTFFKKIAKRVEGAEIPHQNNPVSDYITISIGICILDHQADISFEKLYMTADKALYQAKSSGRNTIEITELK